MNDLAARVAEAIDRRGLFKGGQRILVAVSGGVDSMVLLELLFGLAPRLGWRLTVAHLNHQLRGRDSLADERLVRRRAAKLGLPILVERARVPQAAKAKGLSLEMAARELRHAFLARAAAANRARWIALAHHADDQIELFFLRLLRGSGNQGLAGMRWSSPSPANPQIRLARPLLDQPKAALREYARANQVPFREDSSNRSLSILRNRVRCELLPLLRKSYHGGIDATISRAMDLIGAETDLVGALAEQWLGTRKEHPDERTLTERRRNKASRPAGWPSWLTPSTTFEELPIAVARRVIQNQILGLGVAPDYELIEKIRTQANCAVSCPVLNEPGEDGSTAPKEGSPKVLSRDRFGQVHAKQERMPPFNVRSVPLDLRGGTREIEFDGVRFDWQISGRPSGPKRGGRKGFERFDADAVGSQVLLRHWQPGDRFQPIGNRGRIKLQDFLTNQKVPRDRRRELIVAVSGSGEVFWVENQRISERFKLTSRTKRYLHWAWERL